MGGGGAWGVFAVAFAAAGGACLGAWAWRQGSARMAGAVQLDLASRERAAVLMRAAARPFRVPAACALKASAVQDMVQDAIAYLHAEDRLDAQTCLSLLLGASFLVGALSFVLTLSVAFALAAACLSFVGAWLYVRHQAERAAARMRDEVPDALRSLADSFRSGHSLLQTMQQASLDLEGRLGTAFGCVARRLETGETSAQALTELRRLQGVPELAFVAVALDVQHQSGGSIAPLLESARASVESELELARTLRVQTAQAKLSASIVTIMPFVLVAFFSLASPGFLAPFFESALGVVMLMGALLMQTAGVMAVRRICRVDG